MTQNQNQNPAADDREFVSPAGVLSYPHLAQPDAFKGGVPKFRCSIIVLGDAEASAKQKLADVIAAARQAADDKFKSPDLKGLMLAVGPANERDRETFGDPDALVVKLANKAAPVLFDAYGDKVDGDDPKTHSELFYPGAIVRAKAWAFGWDSGRRGVSFLLQGVQHVDAGEPIGSSSTPVTFDAVKARPKPAEAWEDTTPNDEPADSDSMPF